jgi:hypothetical protein
LGQGAVAPERLLASQQLLHDELAENLLEPAFRAQRAGLNRFFSELQAGTVAFPGIAQHWLGTYADIAFAPVGLRGAAIRNSNAFLLRNLTENVAAASKTDHEAFTTLVDTFRMEFMDQRSKYQIPALAVAWVAVNDRLANGAFRARMRLTCAAAGLAAEQYRLREKRWPASLTDLAHAGDLPSVPVDVCDGQLLRLRRTADGLVIYSVGERKRYDGTARDRDSMIDIDQGWEFRLWDPDDRRQPHKIEYQPIALEDRR